MRRVEVLIERDREVAVLAGVLEAAARGLGGAVLIEGEAGIGKTRLLAFARVQALTTEARVLYATADESEERVPLAAARVLLARAARDVARDGPARLGALALEGALSEPSGLGSRSDEVVHALWWLIVELAEDCPLALFLDDAQWADDLTLGLLRLAARRARELPLALVVAARPAGPGQRHALLAAEREFVRLEPAPFSAAGTARLLELVLGRPGSVAAIARTRAATRGNPLYLLELLEDARIRGLDPTSETFDADRAPLQLVRLVGDRLARLTPPATALAHAVAVLGGDADANRARSLAELEGRSAIAAEEELRRERVLARDAYEFLHPVVAAAARDGIGALDAADLHARAAAILTAGGADQLRVAEHLTRTAPHGDPTVVAALRDAARAAQRLGAPATAVRHLERALTEPPEPDQLDAINLELGRAKLDTGAEDGEQVLSRLLSKTHGISVRVAAARLLAKHFALRGRSGEAVAVLGPVIEALDDSQRELRLELAVDLALIGSSNLATRDAAIRVIENEATSSQRRTPGERLLAAAMSVTGDADPNDADPAIAAARDLLEQRLHRDYPGGFAVGSFSFWAAATLMNADALDIAGTAMDDLRADSEAAAQPDMVSASHWQQAQIAYQRGDLARCELDALGSIEAGGDFARRFATPWLVMVLSEQDRLAEAEELLASAGMLAFIPPSIFVTAALGSRGRLRLAQGDATSAAEDLADAVARNTASGQQRVEPPWRPLLAEALVQADRSREAAEEINVYASLAAAWKTRRAHGHTARLRALVATREHSITLLEEACGHYSASHARLELARSLAELGARKRAAGEPRAARAILRDAHDIAHACSATMLCARARAELLIAGARPRPPAGGGADSLTPGERRIAEMAANGATNREIARSLYLSPKTVEMHLHSSYRKLNLTGRHGLTVALHEQQ